MKRILYSDSLQFHQYINKRNDLSPDTIERKRNHDILEIEVLTWDKNKNVAVLKLLMGSQPSPLIIGSSMIDTDINKQ